VAASRSRHCTCGAEAGPVRDAARWCGAGPAPEVRAGAASRQDPTDRVWAARRPAASGTGCREARNVRLPRLHALSGKTKTGRFWLRRITISKRMRAKLREVNDQLRRRRHQPIPEQGRWLASVVRGHRAYYAVPGDTDAVAAFRTQATRHWYKALRRRSQRTRINWERMNRIAKRWLPPARVMHPSPNVRFDARTPRQEPSALAAHAGICAGGRPQGRSLPRTDCRPRMS
jgi:hypothetical protein